MRITYAEASHGHDPGPEHPETPSRLEAVLRALRASGRGPAATERLAGETDLASVHTADYVARLFALEATALDVEPETPCTPETVLAARASAGLALDLADALSGGEVAAFALTRPPGHHAHPARASGYCFFNNVALAARRCLGLGARRVAVLDWDVHAGDGTWACLFDDPRVAFATLHEARLFPEDDDPPPVHGPDGRFAVSLGLAPGTPEDAWRRAFSSLCARARAFSPDVVLVSAGFDAHADDPMSSLALSDDTYAFATREACTVAPRRGFLLEGGYDLASLARSVVRCVEALS